MDTLEWKLPPALTEAELEVQNSRFDNYIWFRNLGKGAREATCTCCRETFTVAPLQRTITDAEASFLEAAHGTSIACPKCGKLGTILNAALTRSRKLQGKTLTLARVRVESHNEVYIDCYWVGKHYEDPDRFNKLPIWEFDTCYRLTPQGASMVQYYYSPYLGSAQFHDRGDKIIEPFLLNTGTIGQRRDDYILYAECNLQNTFLAHCGFSQFAGSQKILYLCNVIKYPALEQLLKSGYHSIVYQWVVNDVHFRGKLNMRGSCPKDILKLSPKDCRGLRTLGRDAADFLINWTAKWNKQYSISSILDLIKLCGYGYASALLKYGYDPTKVRAYLVRQFEKRMKEYENRDADCRHAAFSVAPSFHSTLQLLVDYHHICRNNDFRCELYPKNVSEAHDAADRQAHEIGERRLREAEVNDQEERISAYERSTAERLQTAQKADESYADKLDKQYRRRVKTYSYSNGKYMIVVPRNALELVEEGRVLHHCVGTYAYLFDKNQTDILFIRRVDATDKPLLTMEVNHKNGIFEVKQCYGFNDDRYLTTKDAWMWDDYSAYVARYEPDCRDFAKKFEEHLHSMEVKKNGSRTQSA